jgi:hypothetical protein
MSRLIDKFHEASKVAAPPMGFRTARPAAAAPKILLIASLEAGTVEKQADYLDAADAVLVRFTGTTLTVKAVQKIAAALPDIPWGLYLADDDAKKGAVMEAGADFILFPIDSQVADTPKDDKTGKILQVESSMDDGLLRAVSDLPVDAVLAVDAFEGNGPALVWHQMMIFQHLANLISKPLIVPAPAGINEKELKALWDAGVDGIMVEMEKAGAAGLKELRQAIEKLPSRSGRKRGKVNAVLPRTAGETPAPTPPDEEEEEEEDE